ncbi:MAG: helix-turn-helix transcriptional regulator [Terracidiphilus sp.]
MTFERLHENLRVVANRRVQAGTLSGKLLAVKLNLGQSHVSNFLHGRRRLSLESMSRLTFVLGFSVEVVPIDGQRDKQPPHPLRTLVKA